MIIEELNFHHLLYFWVVAREGTVVAASRRLRLAQPSISMQIRKLEKAVGAPLFKRAGRGLVLTDIGRDLYARADEVFQAGQGVVDLLRGVPTERRAKLTVGVPDIMPKLITHRLLSPVFAMPADMQVVCYESAFENLLADLAVNRFDVVLSDAPVGSHLKVRAYNHFLGECGITIFAQPKLAARYQEAFPQSLESAPMLLPTPNTELGRSIDQWLYARSIQPKVVGQFYDSALLKEFGSAGVGLFPGPTAIEREIQRQYRVSVVGRIEEIRERFYAITVQRKIQHPGIIAIVESARADPLANH
ncbi:MAG: LysR family transcriptional regulator [Planctomycetota bacterium]|nr:LysR family transcriptional regulator [Planctomycetota bacterium]